MSTGSRSFNIALAVLAVLSAASSAAEETTGRRYALLVGVRDYEAATFAPLKYTENDVETLAGLLRNAGRFTDVRILSSTRGKKVKTDAPTSANLRKEIKALLSRKKRDDLLLVALSGHGMQRSIKVGDKQKDESFFCPADAQLNDNDTLVGLGKLFRDLEECGAGLKLLLVDACRNDPTEGKSLDLDHLPRPPRGTAALFSCKSGERSFETNKLGDGHGVFFYHVLQGLRGKAKNKRGEVTWARLTEYVTDAVADEAPVLIGNGAKQTPHEIRNLTGKSPVLLGPLKEDAGEALFRLGMRLLLGLDGEHDAPAAARSFGQAKEKGYRLAGAALAVMNRWNWGVNRDDAEAERLADGGKAAATPAAKRGQVEAQWLLGVLYGEGLGVEKKHEEALIWLRKAVEQDYAPAQAQLGVMYGIGQGVKQDHTEEQRWYRKAAAQNYAIAQYNLGVRYATGEGVEQDFAEAAVWYRKAADKNYPAAQRNLGWLYENGRGVKKKYDEALSWYRKAAAQNHAFAQYDVGAMYEKGLGVERNLPEAVRWYRKAAAQGNQLAKNNLRRLKQ